MKYFYCIALLIVFAFANVVKVPLLFAQQPSPKQESVAVSELPRPFRLGISGGYGINTHTANFPEFKGFPVFFPRTSVNQGPGNFREGTGMGISIGALYEMPLAQALSLTGRLSYTALDGAMTTTQPTLLGDLQGNVTAAIHEYRINAYLGSIGADVGVKWYPLNGLYAALSLGGAWMLQSTFLQDERLLDADNPSSPLPGGFNPQSFPKIRNEQRGSIPGFSPFQAFASASVGYEIPLGFMRLAPEFGYTVGLTNFFAGAEEWRISRIRAGISALFTFQSLQDGILQMSGETFDDILVELIKPRFVPNNTTNTQDSLLAASSTQSPTQKQEPTQTQTTTVAAKPKPSIDVEAVGILRIGKRVLADNTSSRTNAIADDKPLEERREQRIILPKQELIVRHNYSLLPYIFFDGERSAVLPQRYARLSTEATAGFAPDKLRPSTTLTSGEHPYYHLLNIVGQRMKRLPETKLNILGGIDGSAAERDNLRLARQRALAVATYLRNVWGIDSVRLIIGEARLSNKAGRSFNEQDRQAEYRRVELSSDTAALLEPIQLFDTVSRTLPPRVRIFPRLQGGGAIASWNVGLKQEGRTLKEWRGEGAIPEVLNWRGDERTVVELPPAKPVVINLTARTDEGEELTAPERTLPVEIRLFRSADEEYTDNALLEKFNVILFDVTKSSVAQSQALTLKAMNTRITARSKVLVEGFMDKSDDEEANKRLSRTRAQAVAQSLKFLSRGAQLEIQGYGSQKPLYDERLPEGRIYSRTVLITIETPLIESAEK